VCRLSDLSSKCAGYQTGVVKVQAIRFEWYMCRVSDLSGKCAGYQTGVENVQAIGFEW
jgi:hypothetical protein